MFSKISLVPLKLSSRRRLSNSSDESNSTILGALVFRVKRKKPVLPLSQVHGDVDREDDFTWVEEELSRQERPWSSTT